VAIVGRLIRQKAAADAAERSHPERAAERVRFRQISERALAETRAKFPVLTGDNFQAANEYREARIRELQIGEK
jgi:hypothetical protein